MAERECTFITTGKRANYSMAASPKSVCWISNGELRAYSSGGEEGHDSLQELLQLIVVYLPSHAVEHGSTQLADGPIYLAAVQQGIVQHLLQLAASGRQAFVCLIDLSVHLIRLLQLHCLVMDLQPQYFSVIGSCSLETVLAAHLKFT